jgi:hypothetical protein
MYTDAQLAERIGREAYSYRFVYRAFAPMLQRWGRTIEVTQAESRLDFALQQAREQGLQPIHLSFLPLHLTYLTQHAANVVFPFWEFPDLPNRPLGNNPRNNWVNLARHFALILTASTFTRDAFRRAGIHTPIEVIPVPVSAPYFATPTWTPGKRVVLDTPCYVFPQPPGPQAPAPNPWLPAQPSRMGLRARARHVYKSYVAPRIRPNLDKYLTLAARAIAAARQARGADEHVPYAVSPSLELSGVVYTTILNPYDPRKNWQDTLTAYLLALADCEDATLVLKLVVCPELAAQSLNGMLHYYHQLGIRHRCKLAFVTAYLSEAQMVDLARGSTFYLNSARAEGACLPLQSFLAARRPGIAPDHTAMADYFHDDVGLVIESHPEPAPWPHDPEQRLSTHWHRIVWQSLHDQVRAAYDLAGTQPERYQALAARGRERMLEFASGDRVGPRLSAALDSVANHVTPHADPPPAWRKAS